MDKVLQIAQELGNAILESEIYQRMHIAELQATKDEAAVKAMADFMEARKKVEDILSANDLSRDELAMAGQALEEAEQRMNETPAVKEMQQSRADFTQMMENVNSILKMIITGEVNDDSAKGGCSSCSGGCS
ncbi:MAG: YlbF family regulator, partial [Clostridia bacterium]|nr:YlbF family regulator [Clostridia bacterium]